MLVRMFQLHDLALVDRKRLGRYEGLRLGSLLMLQQHVLSSLHFISPLLQITNTVLALMRKCDLMCQSLAPRGTTDAPALPSDL